MRKSPTYTGVACSIFRKEIEYLIEQGRLDKDFVFVDSELHMNPRQLDRVLEEMIGPGCLFCFGDCHARIADQESSGQISKVKGTNCVEIFLGRELYRKLRAEGAFFLLPEWTHKWKRIFKELLGFSDQEVARQFMNEMHTRFIYVDTGVTAVPDQILEEIKSYFQLPCDILKIDLENLENTIKNALKRSE